MLSTLSSTALATALYAEDEYSTYKGPTSLGYSFSYPPSWNVKKKPIKTHISEVIVTDSVNATTTAGVVVDAVKISSIEDFGTADGVARKVVDVETKKESVNSAEIVTARAVTKDGLTYYIIDYTVDSSRGVKRYVAKVTVTGGQLYAFTAQAKVDNFSGDTDATFARMVDSFTVKRQYS